jgi:hypothetical protein
MESREDSQSEKRAKKHHLLDASSGAIRSVDLAAANPFLL